MWPSVFLFVVLLTAALAASINIYEPLERDEIIEAVNNAKTTWVAAKNFDPSLTKSYVKHLVGVVKQPGEEVLPLLVDEEYGNIEIPKAFDAREKWTMCKALQEIRDQGPCGSCWAVSTTSAFTDRLCIASNGKFNGHLSAQDLLSCCCYCAVSCGQGCKGGDPARAWQYFMLVGIVTGGDYKSREGCQPYTLPSCEHHVPGERKNCSSYGNVPTPTCQNDCYNKKYNNSYNMDGHKCNRIFSFGNDIKAIQKQIMTHGPVSADFYVYEDFLSYKSGVYKHTAGSFVGGHAVKVIGWGVEDGVAYWLVANSWNTDWGDDGYFKILRGTDECGIEVNMSGGYPQL